jgi:hypothetical protein
MNPTLTPGLQLPGIGDGPARSNLPDIQPAPRPALPSISGGISSRPAISGKGLDPSARSAARIAEFSNEIYGLDRSQARRPLNNIGELPVGDRPAVPARGPGSKVNNPTRQPATRDIANRRNDRQTFRSDFADNARQRTQQRRDRGEDLRENWRDGSRDFLNEFKDDVGKPGWRLEYPDLARAIRARNDDNHADWWKKATAAALVRAVRNGYFEDDEPLYVDYGMGGDVYYEGDTVYVNQRPIAADVYANEAAQIANIGITQLITLPRTGAAAAADQPAAPDKQSDAAESSWTPLGVFALSTSSEESKPTRFMQLAVDQGGIIAGTLFNLETKKTSPITGSVDRKSQRACWCAGDKKEIVAETSFFNLTKDEVPVLIHFGKERTEEYLLVRLDAPTAIDAAKDSPAAASAAPK